MVFAHSAVKHILPSIFLLFSLDVLAQDFELVKIQSAYYPKQNLEDASVDGKIGFLEWGVQGAVPQTFKKLKKTVFIHKIGYANLTVFTEVNLPLGKVDSTRYYHSIIYNLGVVQALTTSWLLAANFIPTLASDFGDKLSGRDFLFQANALAVNTKHEKIKYGFGLAYNTRLGRHLVIPMILLKYKIPQFELDMILPDKLSAMMKTKCNIFSYGIKAGLNGGVFNNTSGFQTVSNTVDVMGYTRINIGAAITVRLKDAININIEGGITAYRRLEVIDSNNDVINRTPQASPFVGFGVSYAPKITSSNAKFSL
jgi:hypothetical protein